MKIPKYTKLLLLVTAVFLLTSVANANPVNRNEAKKVGAKFMKTDNLHFVKSYNLSNGESAFYVFNTEKGFVIISADDRALPILAYSNEGRFEEDHIPAPMQAYLNGFVIQFQRAVDEHFMADDYTARQWNLVRTTGSLNGQRNTTVVEPLIKTKWDQVEPYNMLCPEAADGPGGHALVGCTAVAMGQVMRYWRYPQTGQSSYGGIDFGNTTYQWDDMPYALAPSFDSSIIMPTATLLWHCGVTLNMEYGSHVSNAAINAVPYALETYFKYSPDMEFEMKEDYYGTQYYTDDEWIAKLKACLDLGRPIVYGSFIDGSQAGHIFICDGYDTNDMFHLNWGWGGYADHYFQLGAFHGSGYGFNTGNCAVFNIHPAETASVEEFFDESEVVSYEVFDILGRRADNSYNAHHPGVYLIRYTLRSGGVVTKKVILNR